MVTKMTTLVKDCHAEFTEAAFRELAYDQSYTDVTLACEDGGQVRAHRVVLAASSTFFRRLLAGLGHPHPLLYLQGVEVAALTSILHFLYLGRVTVPTNQLDKFHQATKALRIGGLDQVVDDDDTESDDEEIEGDIESILANQAT